MEKVLITGASGLIGHRLTGLLLLKGYAVNHLGRPNNITQKGLNFNTEHVNHYVWDIKKGEIEPKAFDGVSTIIHLAGAAVADKPWTNARKKEIIDSRTQSAGLIEAFLKKNNHTVKTFVSASAVGYYGDCGGEFVTEERQPGTDFLAQVCKEWEQAAIKIGNLGVREVRCRIGIVLAKNGGALPQLIKTMPLGFVNYFSKSNLYYPWIHLDDVCGIILHAIENKNMHGAYNTTGPAPILMKDLMKAILEAKKSNALLLPVPPFALKLVLGELSEVVLSSQKCSNEKIIKAGFNFKFNNIEQALTNIFQH